MRSRPSAPIDFLLVQTPPKSRTLQWWVIWALMSPHTRIEWIESSRIPPESFCWQMDLPFVNNSIWLYWLQMEGCLAGCGWMHWAETINSPVHPNLCVVIFVCRWQVVQNSSSVILLLRRRKARGMFHCHLSVSSVACKFKKKKNSKEEFILKLGWALEHWQVRIH